MPGNSTRYGLHTDPGARHARKLTLLYYPAPWTPAAGGELRVWASGNATTEPPTSVIAPLADRLVLFHSELAHEVAVTRMPRISLTVWGFGAGAARGAPPPSTLDLAPRCTSDHCQKAQRRREAEAFAAGLRKLVRPTRKRQPCDRQTFTRNPRGSAVFPPRRERPLGATI